MRLQSREDAVERGRPEPDEAELESPPLSGRGRWGSTKRAAKAMLEDNMTMIASALAYSTFFAIPSVLLVVIGLFTLIASPQTITTLVNHFSHVMPQQAATLIGQSLQRLESRPSTGIAMTAVGLLLAVWSVTGAMTTYMTAVNLAYGHKDERKFVRKRMIALAMAACIGVAFVLVAVLLILGPQIERHIGAAVGHQSLVTWTWWAAQWPILIAGLLVAFATILYLGPDRGTDRGKWKLITPGALVAAVMWLVISGAFAVYTSRFGSYNKAWGSLSAVIIMLTWLWLSSLALLFGAELNAEIERNRENRRGLSAGT